MLIVDRIKKGIPEFIEQANIVQSKSGGGENQVLSRYALVFNSIRSQTYRLCPI